MTVELSNSQIRVSSDTSSVWNFCSHSSDIFCWGDQWWLAKCPLFSQARDIWEQGSGEAELKQGHVKCLGDMSVHAFYSES